MPTTAITALVVTNSPKLCLTTVLRSSSRLQVHLALLRKTATAVHIVVQASSDHIQLLSRIERDHRAFRITSAIAQQQQVSINQQSWAISAPGPSTG
jgi:hypothetical protein